MIASLQEQFGPRTRQMRAFVDQEHYRYQRRPDATPGTDEVMLTDDWNLELEVGDTPLLDRAVGDFRAWLMTCMDVRPVGGGSGTLRFELTGEPGVVGDRLDPASEAFELRVAPDEIVLSAPYERGLLHGSHYVERLMADRGGPILAAGEIRRQPTFMPRIGNSIFIKSHQDCGDLEQFPQEYLSLLSHFGINGVHLHLDLWEYCRSETAPEIDNPEFAREMARINRVIERLAEHGIDTYLYLIAVQLPPEHPLFAGHPERRGSTVQNLPGMPKRYVACTSNSEVQKLQQEIVANIFRAAPDAAGAVMIVGGEGYMHCYSRPLAPFEGYTDCPHCRDIAPSQAVAELVNRIAATVHEVGGADKAFFTWPYSAFTWSGEDKAQLEWIENLDTDVNVLANFATNSPDPHTAADVVLYDYNIKTVGPTAVFQAQADKVHELGRRMYAKVESNTTPSVFFIPYLPVHYRWHERFQAMAATGVAGYICQWRFYGPNGSPPEEMQYHVIWNPERDTEELLATVAQRDFGLDSAQAEVAVGGWRQISDAWDDFPYSALTAGERIFYMAGPLWYGPAHPLIWDPRRSYDLLPEFRALPGSAGEGASDEEIIELTERNPPRYAADLMMTLPFGVERYLELIGSCVNRWAAGLGVLEGILGDDPNQRARMELDVATILLIHLRSVRNAVRFFACRDQLWHGHLNGDRFQTAVAEAKQIVREEMANAERALPILERDNRIGYIHCYGIAYTDVMVRDKLRQCQYLLDDELPLFDATVRFHIWNDYTPARE